MDAQDLEEIALGTHVRALLLDYVRTHLTIDYLAFTEDSVGELLCETLREVPLHGPYSFTLLEDTFTKLFRLYDLESLESYDEKKILATAEGITYLKRSLAMQGISEGLKAERVWWEDAYAYDPSMYRPLSPVLTSLAKRETPQMGSNPVVKSLQQSGPTFILSQSINPLEVEEVSDPELKVDDVLNARFSLGSDEHASVVSLIKSTQALSNPGTGRAPKCSSVFSYVDDVPPCYLPPESPFVPIFSKADLPGSLGNAEAEVSHHSGLQSISDLPTLVPQIKLENSDDDLYREHMIVVDGWQTYNISSPPSQHSSTRGSSQENDELDRYFLRSSPNTDPPFIKALSSSQLEEVLVPRDQRIGGMRKKACHIGADDSFSAFLLPLITTEVVPDDLETQTLAHPASPKPAESLVGQPPSALDSDDEVIDKYDGELDMVIQSIYRPYSKENIKDIVYTEKLEERDDLLMDVPTLPSPNQHSISVAEQMPTRLADLVALKGEKSEQRTSNLIREFLKKAKLQALSMELSWSVSKPTEQMPTTDEVVDTVSAPTCFDPDVKKDDADAQIQLMFEKALVLIAGDNTSAQDYATREKNLWLNGLAATRRDGFSAEIAHCEAILTREERRRLSGLPHIDLDDGCSPRSRKQNDDHGPESLELNSEPPSKRPRISMSHDEQDQRQQNHSDDSGIAFVIATSLDQPDDAPYEFLPTDVDGGIGQSWPRSNSLQNATSESRVFGTSSATATDSVCVRYSSGDESLSFLNLDDDMDKDNTPLERLDFPPQDFSETSQHGYEQYRPDYANDDLPVYYSNEETDNGYNGSFLPLSFDSHQPTSAYASQLGTTDYPQDTLNEESVDRPRLGSSGYDANESTTYTHRLALESSVLPENEADTSGSSKNSNFDALVLPTNALGVSSFANLRGRRVTEPPLPLLSNPIVDTVTSNAPEESADAPSLTVSNEILSRNTLQVPSPWTTPVVSHKYLASMEVIQKQVLVRCLRSRECAVDLVERDSLDGVHLIMDPDTAVIFTPLHPLPARREALVSDIAEQSWRYTRLFIVFEAYPEADGTRVSRNTGPAPSAYSPPIIKALQKLWRDLDIADACGTKRAGTAVRCAFADCVVDTARLVRHAGNSSEAMDATQGALWGARAWLDGDAHEAEADMARMPGMNTFAAFVVLAQTPLRAFLDMAPGARAAELGPLVGAGRIAELNAVIEERMRAMQASESEGSEEAQTECEGGRAGTGQGLYS